MGHLLNLSPTLDRVITWAFSHTNFSSVSLHGSHTFLPLLVRLVSSQVQNPRGGGRFHHPDVLRWTNTRWVWEPPDIQSQLMVLIPTILVFWFTCLVLGELFLLVHVRSCVPSPSPSVFLLGSP